MQNIHHAAMPQAHKTRFTSPHFAHSTETFWKHLMEQIRHLPSNSSKTLILKEHCSKGT
ncbi:hypothetical protein WN943_025647 [Citrus x changshan-huyou]